MVHSHLVPIFASPILLFQKGAPYRRGEAPSIASMFAHSLESVRMSDAEVPIFLITNFEVTSADTRLLQRLNVTRLDAEQILGSNDSGARALLKTFVSRCPLRGGNLFATATVLRYFYVLGAMRHFALDSLFFLEGDNLLLRPVRELAALYGVVALRAHASHSHVSLHASFISFDFVRAIASYAAHFVGAQQRCPFDGGGQDMALSYEAALALHVALRRRGEGPARIVNAVGGAVPCEMQGRPWRSSIDNWCQSLAKTGDTGLCKVNPRMVAFRNKISGALPAGDLPLLYECAWPTAPNGSHRVPGSIQLNLKGVVNMQSPGTSRLAPEMDAWARSPVSSGFACKQPYAYNTPSRYNKEIVFARGRAFSRTLRAGAASSIADQGRDLRMGWLEYFNLHFQGGGCKGQMGPVLAALRRSRDRNRPFSCEGSFNVTAPPEIRISQYEECLVTGAREQVFSGLVLAER